VSIELVSHASVVVRCADTAIWTDPWLSGSAFNNSWELLGPAPTMPEDLESIRFLWVSHEHPDHFNIPTLRSLPESFRERVTVLFQSINSHKVFDAFSKMGYPNHLALPSRKLLRLPGSTCRVYCYPVGQMDSVLGVSDGDVRVLNVNDAELDPHDCRNICKDFGTSTVLLSQFSYAGYTGMPNPAGKLKEMAAHQLELMATYHRDLGAQTTIPFASFMYFSRTDNCYMNPPANRPSDVVRYLEPRGHDVVVLAPGDVWTAGTPHDNGPAVALWEREFDTVPDKEFAPSETMNLDELESAFHDRVRSLRTKFPRAVLRLMKPVTIRVSDLDATVRLCFGTNTFEALETDGAVADVEMNSQPVWFMLSQPFGMQTVGTSARYRLTNERSFGNWRRHRILFAFDNAELYLRPARLVGRANAQFVRTRFTLLPRQIAYQLRRMR
jgi:hypothetical protein